MSKQHDVRSVHSTQKPCREVLAAWVWKGVAASGVVIAAAGLMGQYGGATMWWEPRDGGAMQSVSTMPDKTGDLMVYMPEGTIRTGDHAFFQNIGSNGRACVTCHQPSSAMSLSAERIRERWETTHGTDPLFAAVDGSNCPNLPQNLKSAHSLLLERGVFRIALPWPAAGVKPDFTLEVVRDPTGCNIDPIYGLHSEHPTISVYRRPRVVGNLRYVLASDAATDLNHPASGLLTADGRDTTLVVQANDAMHAHEQKQGMLTEEQLTEILDFESQVYVAQDTDDHAGDLTEVDGPKALGAWNLSSGKTGRGGPSIEAFPELEDWLTDRRTGAQYAYRASVARGQALFETRKFAIKNVAGMSTHGSAVEGTCATCHNATLTGSNLQQAPMDVGSTVLPYEIEPNDLPLFKVTCHSASTAHPYLGRVLYTTDPGRALVTGKCADVGSIVMQQFRGLTARAPYFSNGSAATLGDVVNFYDKRFQMKLSAQDRDDLVHFLEVL